MAVLDCRGKVHLNQVYLCLEQDETTHLPGAQVNQCFASATVRGSGGGARGGVVVELFRTKDNIPAQVFGTTRGL